MTITTSLSDRGIIAEKLETEGVDPTPQNISTILENVAKAFAQQFDEEAQFMVEALRDDLED